MACLIVVGSVASGGATTVAVGLAAVLSSPQSPALLVEADPPGGVLAARHHLHQSPGLVELAAAARSTSTPVADLLTAYTQPIQIGEQEIRTVVAPPGGDQSRVALTALYTRRDILHPPGRTTIVDCGRLTPSSAAFSLIPTADVVLLLARGRLEEIAHLRERAGELDRAAGARLTIVLTAGGVYGAEDVADDLVEPFGRAVTIRGPLPYDERGARVLDGELAAGKRWWRGLPLLAALNAIAGSVVQPTIEAARQVRRHAAPAGAP